MQNLESFSSLLYVGTLRVIQPARVQDVYGAISQVWGDKAFSVSKEAIYEAHDFLRQEGAITQIRKGSYILTPRGMSVALGISKGRKLDNLRLFLMKRQRRNYSKNARRHE